MTALRGVTNMAPDFGTMSANANTVKDGVLEQLTLPELIDVWAEDEIYRRLQQVDLISPIAASAD